METFLYRRILDDPQWPYKTEAALWFDRRENVPPSLVRLLDVFRAKGILTGRDVCVVLGDGWEPCSSDMPPPWGTP